MKNSTNQLSEFKQTPSVEILSTISQVAITSCPEETSSIINEGAILLAVTKNAEDDMTDFPFKFLLGLPNGINKTPYLSNFFKL